MGRADGLDALAARARVLWVPVHLGGGHVGKPCEGLSAFLQTGRMGLGVTQPRATTSQNDLMPSYDKRRGLHRPWEGTVPSARSARIAHGRKASAVDT